MCTLLKLFVLCVFIFSDTNSKRIRPPGLDSLKTKKISECERCKVLTDSFSHWLERTSRGKYEGGDAAWEESKLKSYARSEIRLVEIQEGLCSEVKRNQDDCYTLSEESEQVLEKWWFQEDPNSADLHTWLCIETLKYCCPANHFGESCTPCPLDIDSNICSGHGDCDGEGTRKGNGTCICEKGYSGQYCEECAQNFYSEDGLCKQCHKACDGCSREGPDACITCKTGWHLETGVCVDIDECSIPSKCKNNQFCVNKEGSFRCKSCDTSCKTCDGPGASNCSSCEVPNILWTGMCITKDQQNNMLNNIYKRFGLYFGLLVIFLIMIYRTSYLIAAVLVLVNSIFIYYNESMSEVPPLDVVYNIYKLYTS